MVALSNAIIYGFVGDKYDINKNERISLLTKCAIDSDATIGFNLPLIDIKKPENGNFFVSIMNEFRNVDIKKEVDAVVQSTSKEEKILILKAWKKYKKDESISDILKEFEEWSNSKMKEFRTNMTNLTDTILKKAKEIKEDAEKTRKAEAEKTQQESDIEDKA